MLTPTSTAPQLTRRERERQARRQAMLDAARAVFAEKGYTHATLDEIAQRAEFGKGTLYNYFKNKEELLFAIFDELYDEWVQLVETTFSAEVAAGQPLREAFHSFVEANLTFFMLQRDLFIILIKEAQRMCFSDDSEKVSYFMQQRERMVTALVPPLETAMERGELRPLPAHAVAHMILGNVNGLQMHLTLEQCDNSEDAVLGSAQQAAGFLTTMLFDGLSASPADQG